MEVLWIIFWFKPWQRPTEGLSLSRPLFDVHVCRWKRRSPNKVRVGLFVSRQKKRWDGKAGDALLRIPWKMNEQPTRVAYCHGNNETESERGRKVKVWQHQALDSRATRWHDKMQFLRCNPKMGIANEREKESSGTIPFWVKDTHILNWIETF